MVVETREDIALAEKLYLDSICAETGFKPMTFQELVYKLEEHGYKSSTSTLQRWCERWGWREKAQNLARNLASTTIAKNIASKASVDAQKNIESMVAESSDVLLDYVRDVSARHSKNPKEIELVLKIMTASAMLITKPLEKPVDDKVDSIQLLERLRQKDDSELVVDAEIEQ